jgi:hypothetical protein
MYRLFYDGGTRIFAQVNASKVGGFGCSDADADYLSKLRRLLAKMEPDEQRLVLHMAQKVAKD